MVTASRKHLWEPQPSYYADYARSAYESARPQDWDGLKSLWIPQLGPTGSVMRDLVGAYPGTLTNMTSASDWIIHPLAGYGVDFDGTNDYAAVSTIELTGSCTWLVMLRSRAWTYPGNDFDITGIVGKGGWDVDANGDFRITLDGTNIRAEVFTSGGNVQAVYATSNLNTTDIYQIAAVYNEPNTAVNLYVDGTSRASNTTSGTMSNNSHVIRFATFPLNEANTEWNGTIFQVRLYRRALTERELREIYYDPLGIVRFRPSAPTIITPAAGADVRNHIIPAYMRVNA